MARRFTNEQIAAALRAAEGNIQLAAAALGSSRGMVRTRILHTPELAELRAELVGGDNRKHSRAKRLTALDSVRVTGRLKMTALDRLPADVQAEFRALTPLAVDRTQEMLETGYLGIGVPGDETRPVVQFPLGPREMLATIIMAMDRGWGKPEVVANVTVKDERLFPELSEDEVVQLYLDRRARKAKVIEGGSG